MNGTKNCPQWGDLHLDVTALKEAEYLKDEFIGVVAHKLRNPLEVLKGFASMLVYQTKHGKGAELSEWQQEALEEIDEATTRLDKLTEDLLDVTRLQAGRLALSRTLTDLVALIQYMLPDAPAHLTRVPLLVLVLCLIPDPGRCLLPSPRWLASRGSRLREPAPPSPSSVQRKTVCGGREP